MKKRILSLVTLISFVLSLSGFVTFANDYSDSWAADAIFELLKNEIISGDASGKVNPENDIKRCEFVKVINKIAGYTKKADKNFHKNDNYY